MPKLPYNHVTKGLIDALDITSEYLEGKRTWDWDVFASTILLEKVNLKNPARQMTPRERGLLKYIQIGNLLNGRSRPSVLKQYMEFMGKLGGIDQIQSEVDVYFQEAFGEGYSMDWAQEQPSHDHYESVSSCLVDQAAFQRKELPQESAFALEYPDYYRPQDPSPDFQMNVYDQAEPVYQTVDDFLVQTRQEVDMEIEPPYNPPPEPGSIFERAVELEGGAVRA
ncbi:MAG: hypothetical protein R3D58_21985 [Saprospiraceae bacterium]